MTESAPSLSRAEPGQSLWSKARTFFVGLSNVQRSLLLAGFFAVVYVSTHSGAYVPNSDGTLYLCVARNLYDGHGYTFNGEAVINIPPGWPFLLAGAMHISRSFFFLGMIPVLCLSGAIAIWYLVICRCTDPIKAFFAMLICGLLHTWYVSAQNYFSEAPYMLCLGAAVLLAQQIAAGASWYARLPALLLLTFATVCFRWVGIASWAIIAAAVLGGAIQFRPNRKWLTVGLIMVTVFAAYQLCTRYVTSPSHVAAVTQEAVSSNTAAAEGAAQADSGAETNAEMPVESEAQAAAAQPLKTRPIAINTNGRSQLVPSRLLRMGEWLTSLLCAPAELARVSRLVSKSSNLIGWVLWMFVAVWSIHRARQGDWLWLGGMLYCLMVMLRWSHVVQRYMLPAAPLLVISIWNGADLVFQKIPKLSGAWITRPLFCSILLINGLLLATDVYIARSENFGERFFAGYSVKLVQASGFLREHHVSEGEVAVSSRYINLNMNRPNTYAERQMNLLIGRSTRRVPAEVCQGEPDEALVKWAMQNNVRYYLFRTPVSPWRVWHFRMPELQEWITKKPVEEQPDWVLYDLSGGDVKLVDLPESVAWPTTVPDTIFR